MSGVERRWDWEACGRGVRVFIGILLERVWGLLLRGLNLLFRLRFVLSSFLPFSVLETMMTTDDEVLTKTNDDRSILNRNQEETKSSNSNRVRYILPVLRKRNEIPPLGSRRGSSDSLMRNYVRSFLRLRFLLRLSSSLALRRRVREVYHRRAREEQHRRIRESQHHHRRTREEERTKPPPQHQRRSNAAVSVPNEKVNHSMGEEDVRKRWINREKPVRESGNDNTILLLPDFFRRLLGRRLLVRRLWRGMESPRRARADFSAGFRRMELGLRVGPERSDRSGDRRGMLDRTREEERTDPNPPDRLSLLSPILHQSTILPPLSSHSVRMISISSMFPPSFRLRFFSLRPHRDPKLDRVRRRTGMAIFV